MCGADGRARPGLHLCGERPDPRGTHGTAGRPVRTPLSPRAQEAGLAFTFVLVAAGVIVQLAVIPPGARAAGRSQGASRTAAAMEHRMRPDTQPARNAIAPTAPASASPAVREQAPLQRAADPAHDMPARAAAARPEASSGSTRAARSDEVHPAAEAAAASRYAAARATQPDTAAMPQPAGPSHGEAARSSATVNAVALVPAAQPRQDPKAPSSAADDRAPAPAPLARHGAGAPQAPGETIEETPEPALQGTQLSLLGPATGREDELLTYAVVVENAQAVSH